MDSTTMKGTVQGYFDRAFDEMTETRCASFISSARTPSGMHRDWHSLIAAVQFSFHAAPLCPPHRHAIMPHMFFKCHSAGMLRWAAQGVRLAAACCLFALTVLQGLTFCLCAPDPDACGDSCHDCGTPPAPSDTHVEHLCEHLALADLPPGEPVPAAVRELAGLLLALASAPSVACVPVALPAPPARHSERPPGVLAPQFLFLARSTQILC